LSPPTGLPKAALKTGASNWFRKDSKLAQIEYQPYLIKRGYMTRITSYAIAGLLAVVISIGAAAPAGTQEQAAAAASTSATPAIVVDSTGKEVGPLINTGGADSALVKVGSNDFALQVNSEGFVQTGVTFSYPTVACSGTPFVISLASNSLYISYPATTNSTTNVQGNYSGGVAGSNLYFAKPKTSASMTINSISVVASNGKSQICYPLTPTKFTVSDVATLNLSALGFVEPFKLSL
jgi:hypothetical protein